MDAVTMLGVMEKMIYINPRPDKEKLCFTMNTNDLVILGGYFGQQYSNLFKEVKIYGIPIYHNSEVPQGNIYLGEKL